MAVNQSAMPAVTGGRRATRRQKVWRVVGQIVLLLAVIAVALPLIWCFFLSLKTNTEIFASPLALPDRPMWSNYADALRIMNLPVLLKNTLFIAVVSISLSMTMTILSSFAIGRMRFGKGRLQNFFYIYFISGVIVPVFVLLLPVYTLTVRMGLIDTLWSLILPYLGWAAPMNTLIMVGSFRSMSESIEEASIMDGCGLLRMIFAIEVPILKPTIATAFIIQFLGVYNDFPLAVVLLTSPQVRTVALAASLFKSLYSLDYSLMTAGIVILVIPQLILFSFFQKYIIDGISVGAVKG